MSRILHKSFRYTPAAKTDIRKTFARIERERKQAEAARAQVTPITKARKA